jgi:hypothetical protein
VEHISASQWSSIRAEMRSALKNQPSAQERVKQDHQAWKEYWSGRSKAVADEAAGLAWYHSYCLDPSVAMDLWNELTKSARKAIPASNRSCRSFCCLLLGINGSSHVMRTLPLFGANIKKDRITLQVWRRHVQAISDVGYWTNKAPNPRLRNAQPDLRPRSPCR